MGKTKMRTVCVASDGESRRGEALIQLTFKRELDTNSSIYPHLKPLPFMNLEVGDDDLTADKDYKHVFKRLRNLMLRTRGLKVHGIDITLTTIRSHLRSNNLTATTIENLLKPDDKQDVKLAYDLLKEIWSLPAMASDSEHLGARDSRKTFRTLGALFRHILMPYICVDLSLSEQLAHLSAAAHMLLAMLREDNAGAKLMPTQLYTDIMIMIKNAYFCVAKCKVDDPTGKFWIILLGTDRLEELFGILRTMVGNDANVDVLQLVLRLTGTTEVSTILAQYPHWDSSPRRLYLPALSKDGLEIHDGVDHIKPASWRGDVDVANVNLQTCWKLGRLRVEKEHPRLGKILQELDREHGVDCPIDILRPYGKDLVRANRGDEDYDNTAEDFEETPVSTSLIPPGPEIEDAAAEEDSNNTHSPCFKLNNQNVYKARYLNQLFKEFKNPGSRDRLKRVANIPRYAIKQDQRYNVVDSDDTDQGGPSLRIDTPVATLVKCEDHLFVCIGEVNDIKFDSKHTEEIAVELLSEPTVHVSFQVIFLVPATVEDDPLLKNDWRWSLRRGATHHVPGRLVEPLNPAISTKSYGKPSYLFESAVLMAVGATILERLVREDGRLLPEITRSEDFPYRETSGQLIIH